MKNFRILIACMAMLISAPAFATAGSPEASTTVELNDINKPEGKKPKKKKKKNKTKAKKEKADKAKSAAMKKGKKAPKEEVDQ